LFLYNVIKCYTTAANTGSKIHRRDYERGVSAAAGNNILSELHIDIPEDNNALELSNQ